MTGRHRRAASLPTSRLAAWTALGAALAAITTRQPAAATPPAPAPVAVTKPVVLHQPPARIKPTVVMAAAKTVPSRALKVIGRQGLTPNAVALLDYIDRTYPEVTTVGGVRADPLPDHPSGHAIDIMVPNQAVGQRICDDILNQFARFNVRYLIWQETYRRPGVSRWMADRGSATANHFDHVHITVN